ncbi:hypothetical protein CANCADRAFT_23484 [Tortispora caseinolytica NRRL Y-17796]|uniref:Uncharacterized protein n=1 Tax=Tortispora caseinolytica NRRL Y-17796 TaxID=767744 RepID=A0A1E4TKC1_9ASCO|nr:hypothetical protein CANCADRAFT_23484 [Tortispora caseinolytica NRRL Y-17796]
MEFNPLTPTTRPLQDSFITVRMIKSFEYQTFKSVVLPDVDLTTLTGAQLLEKMKKIVHTENGYKPYKSCVDQFDTVKIYSKAHGTKTMNLIINLEDDNTTLIENLDLPLSQAGVENETELSIFNRDLYEKYKANPVNKWV